MSSELKRYSTGVLDLPIVNVINEGLTFLMIVTIITGFTGNEVWITPSIIPSLLWTELAQIVFSVMLVGSLVGQ